MESQPPPVKRENDDDESPLQKMEAESPSAKRDGEDDETLPKQEPQAIEYERDADNKDNLQPHLSNGNTAADNNDALQAHPPDSHHNPLKREHAAGNQEASLSNPPPKKKSKKSHHRKLPNRRICVHCFRPGHQWTHCFQKCMHCDSKSHSATFGRPGMGERCPVLEKSFPEFFALGSAEENMIQAAHEEREQQLRDTVENVKRSVKNARDGDEDEQDIDVEQLPDDEAIAASGNASDAAAAAVESDPKKSAFQTASKTVETNTCIAVDEIDERKTKTEAVEDVLAWHSAY